MTYFLLNLRFQISFTSAYFLLTVNKMTLNEKITLAVRQHILLHQENLSKLSDSTSYYTKTNCRSSQTTFLSYYTKILSRSCQTTYLTTPKEILGAARQHILLHQEKFQDLSDNTSYHPKRIVGAVRQHILLRQDNLS